MQSYAITLGRRHVSPVVRRVFVPGTPITRAEQLVAFGVRAAHDALVEARQALRVRVLHSLACAIGGVTGPLSV
jgi:hypothetical protein